MEFVQTGLAGAFLLKPARLQDDRGWFARTWCQKDFAAHGIEVTFVQGNVSRNRVRGTLRGLHFQLPPSRESKLVRCSQGEIWDVIVDLRAGSATYLRHYAATLSAENGHSLFIPAGFGHGFQTLCDDAEVVYAMGDYYDPALSAGARWDDAAFGIGWPLGRPTVMSNRDRGYADFPAQTFDAFRGY
jgi:dTDP-4-dehydrorhamnose 3,5-epimerase